MSAAIEQYEKKTEPVIRSTYGLAFIINKCQHHRNNTNKRLNLSCIHGLVFLINKCQHQQNNLNKTRWCRLSLLFRVEWPWCSKPEWHSLSSISHWGPIFNSASALAQRCSLSFGLLEKLHFFFVPKPCSNRQSSTEDEFAVFFQCCCPPPQLLLKFHPLWPALTSDVLVGSAFETDVFYCLDANARGALVQSLACGRFNS